MKDFKAAFLSMALMASPAMADVWEYGPSDCNQLWFMRNLIMDRAGYCFGSNLGKALFDNADCQGRDVGLTAAQETQVAKIQNLERQIGCKVDTGKRHLDVADMAALRRLRDLPLPDNGGAACSWDGAPLPLYDGIGYDADVIGRINPGDRVYFGWIGEGTWNVLSIRKGGEGGASLLGWHDTGAVDFERACTDWAG